MHSYQKIEKWLQEDNGAVLREEARKLAEEERRKNEGALRDATGMSAEDVGLLLRFAEAAGNLYGRIPLEDFYRIVRDLAPELKIEQETFLSFMRGLDGKQNLYVAEPGNLETVPEKATMDCELLAQWVAWDYDTYDAIRERHAKCPRYVPKREEFLQYADDSYYEDTPAKQTMRDFLTEQCGLRGEDIDKWLDQILTGLHIATDLTPETLLQDAVNSYAMRPDLFLRIRAHSQEFARCVGALYEHLRFVYTNGHTLAELRKMQDVTGIEVEPPVDFSEYELVSERESKIGRNEPCPCGSGKKYKKCCGRGK